MALEQFSVSWDNFHKNMSSGMNSLLKNEDFVDVTLAVEGRYLKAHKMVLSVCSLYFRDLFKTSPCKHPIVFMKDVSYTAMSDLLQFMYQGQVQVNKENFDTFIKTAESLQIRGLSHNDNIHNGSYEETPDKDVSFVKYEVPKSENFAPNEQPHLTLTPTPVQSLNSSTVKLEAVAECVSSEDNLTQFKMEPCDQELSPSGNFSDDPLDENIANDDKNEEFWMAEGGEENPLDSTSAYEALEGEDAEEILPSTPPHIRVLETKTASNLLPSKSRHIYEKKYADFKHWRQENNILTISENVMLAYFEEQRQKYKSSSLWSLYSQLKSCISLYNSVDISKYEKIQALLKQSSEGYTPKKSKILKEYEINKFISDAEDNIYLAMKVILIMGFSGACRREELTNMTIDDVKYNNDSIIVSISKTNHNLPREFTITEEKWIQLVRNYAALRPKTTTHRRFFLSYRNGRCVNNPIGINTMGKVSKEIAIYLRLPQPELFTGHCFRRSSAIQLANRDLIIVKRHGGWKSSTVTEGYVEGT